MLRTRKQFQCLIPFFLGSLLSLPLVSCQTPKTLEVTTEISTEISTEVSSEGEFSTAISTTETPTTEVSTTETPTSEDSTTEAPTTEAPTTETPTTEAPATTQIIDCANTSEGYIRVYYPQPSSARLKVQVKGPTTDYTYNLTPQKEAIFPLSDGNGTYQIILYQNVTGTKYAALYSVNTVVTLRDEFAPFLHSNQYVDYDHAPNTVQTAASLIGSVSDRLRQIELVYDYVIQVITYDHSLANSVQSGYLPVLDQVLAKRSGICFDYAALMTGMLRCQGVPCKLVIGYAGTTYHAWISVWIEGSGWIDGIIWFDGFQWQRMDPTFAASGQNSASILEYIGNGTHYTAKYFY